MEFRLGIDVACRAAHQASLADETGKFLFTGRRFRSYAEELEQLWAALPVGTEPAEVTVVMEPTRNAWVPLAAWFRRRGARVVIVPPERSADLRAYFSKHTKSDRLDSRMLARLPMLHPEGLHEEHGLGPGEALRRMTKLRSNLVKRRTACLARLDALLEILGPGWSEVFRADLSNTTPLRFLAAGYACPHTVRRLGKAAELLQEAAEDVLAHLHFPREHRRRLHSTNPIERLHKEVKRRTRVVGIFPTLDSLMRLVGTLLAEQDDELQVADRRYFSIGSMAKVDELEGGDDPKELLAAIA